MFARIRAPRSKNEDVPRSLTSGGVTIAQGGAGKAIEDPALIGRLKTILGDKLETSKIPFPEAAPGKGIITPREK